MTKEDDEILFYENYNLLEIVTPVDVQALESLLVETKYDSKKAKYLVEGFTKGFSIKFEGPCIGRRTAPNLKLRVGSKLELWNKVMKEVQLGRYAGPFEEPPFENFIQSPIGLVPKDQGKKTRLIFHLSYPRTGDSVNSGIPKQFTIVKYPDFEEAVKLCILAGAGCFTAKSDMSAAFRNVPLAPEVWKLMVMKAEHPVTGNYIILWTNVYHLAALSVVPSFRIFQMQ